MKSTFHSTLQLDRTDRVVEGLRIPSSLDSTLAVNFVLTQEPGKLKPKDLKAAIEKNRAERELRAEEQRKIREESGGADGLDLRSILAEEKLNVSKAGNNNAFNRQLREIAFLADVEEVEKQETEKEFRISEDYLGSNLLSDADIMVIKQQRELLSLYKKKQRWNSILSRQHTISHVGHKGSTSSNSNNHNQEGEKISAGPVVTLKAGTNIDTLHELLLQLKPQFDPNRNDIWSKRMNTLRKFIILTSKWIVRKRVEKRLLKLLFYFHENKAFTRAEVLQFIILDNINARNMSNNAAAKDLNKEKEKEREKLLLTQGSSDLKPIDTTVGTTTATNDSIKTLNQFSFTEIFFTQMPSTKLKYQEQQEVLLKNRLLIKAGESEVTPEMIRRNLFPQFTIDILAKSSSSSSSSSANKKSLTSYLEKPQFNDLSFYHLKQKPHYQQLQYTPQEHPKLALYYPSGAKILPRSYGYEENYQRKGANLGMSLNQYAQVTNATITSEGRALDPLLQLSEKCYTLSRQDYLAKEVPKRVEIPGSLHETLIHDTTCQGNLEMYLQLKDTLVINDVIGDDLLPPWLVHTCPYSQEEQEKALEAEEQRLSQAILPVPPKVKRLKAHQRRFQQKQLVMHVHPNAFAIRWSRPEVDFWSHYPHYRSFLPYLTLSPTSTGLSQGDERDVTWRLRPQSTLADRNPYQYQVDSSLRSQWSHYPSASGFLSSQYYLLGQMESCWRDDYIPPVGPTLTTYYAIDTDHHHSGLNCFQSDHLRDTNEWDNEVEGFQRKLALADYLTDSESDNDEEEEELLQSEAYRPSMKRVKRILKPSPVATTNTTANNTAATTAAAGKGKGKDPPAKPAAAPAPTLTQKEEVSLDNEEEEGEVLKKKEEQVELLRDRKLLDLEATYRKSRQFLAKTMNAKLLSISQEMSCWLSTLPIQLSFHEYDSAVYGLMNSMLPEVNYSLVEQYHPSSHNQSLQSLSSSTGLLQLPLQALPSNTSLTLTNNFSPVKTFNKYHPPTVTAKEGEKKKE